MAEPSRYPRMSDLSPEDETKLIRRAQSQPVSDPGRWDRDDARAEIVRRCAGMVREQLRVLRIPQHDQEDATQDGMAGLIMAINRFDVARGVRFTTPAYHWVAQAIRRGVQDRRAVRESYSMEEKRVAVVCHQGRHRRADGSAPDLDAAIDALGIRGQSAQRLRAMPPPQVVSYDRAYHFNPLIHDGEEKPFLSILIDHTTPDPADAATEAVDLQRQRAALYAALDALPPKEREAITRRWVRAGWEPVQLHEVGRAMGFSRQMAHNYERRAIERIRRHPAVRALLGGLPRPRLPVGRRYAVARARRPEIGTGRTARLLQARARWSAMLDLRVRRARVTA